MTIFVCPNLLEKYFDIMEEPIVYNHETLSLYFSKLICLFVCLFIYLFIYLFIGCVEEGQREGERESQAGSVLLA